MLNKKADILVIGAGLSGLIAAAKVSESGKKVVLAAKGKGALELSTGCIDVWGSDEPIHDLQSVVAENPFHPYAKVMDSIEESIDFLANLTASYGYEYRKNASQNWLLPTALGTVRPTFLVPDSMAVPPLGNIKDVLVVGFQGLADFYPEVAIENLKTYVGPESTLRKMEITLGCTEIMPNLLAHKLSQKKYLDQVIAQIKGLVGEETIVLFPPLLGVRSDYEMINTLRASLGCFVYEVANIPPSLPGQRLFNLLLHHLKEQGVEILLGCEISNPEISGRKCLSVVSQSHGRKFKITAQDFILASGSFFGGGLEADKHRIQEKIFSLPVCTSGEEWANCNFLHKQGHPFNRFGIMVNEQLQPIDEDGRICLKNLYAAGTIIGGSDFAAEKCGNGVALSTGYKAGKLVGGARKWM